MKSFSLKHFVLLIIFFNLSIISIFSGLSWYEIFSILLFFTILFRFIDDLGKTISMRNMIAMIATLQFLIGPVLGYLYNKEIYESYQMAVPKNQYFGFALPGTILFLAGLYWKKDNNIKMQYFQDKSAAFSQKGVLFIIIGFISSILPIGFVGFLLSGLMYVGAFYIYLSNNAYKYYWIVFVFGGLLISSLGEGMFHNFFLWGSFLVMIYFIRFPQKYGYKIIAILIGFILMYLVQIAKSEYRQMLWAGQVQGSSKVGTFLSVVNKKISEEEEKGDNQLANSIVRINQGWIIAKVMDYIPERAPYAGGETIKESLIASIFPRFMFPDKPLAGGRENMERFAGVTLLKGTSMDISLLGEGYANFGVFGGWIFMFFIGLFHCYVLYFLDKKSMKHPELLLWIPLIFLQVVKAETSLLTILNHMVKALLVTWFFFSPWGRQFLNIHFLPVKRKRVQLPEVETKS